jgi:transposase
VSTPERQSWSPKLRDAARQIRRDTGAGPTVIMRRINAEHGVNVSLGTVKSWLRKLEPETEQPTVGDLAARALRLSSQELRRLERSSPSKVDLDRLNRVAQILKTLEPLTRAKSGASGGLMTLADLSADGGAPEPGRERVPLSRPNGAARL